jgi:hypothetical protein
MAFIHVPSAKVFASMGTADARALSSGGGDHDTVSDALAQLDELSPSAADGAVSNNTTDDDSRAFLLGQRSALQFAFTSALPARAALGSLQAGLQSLRQSTAETSEHVHALSVGQAILSQRLACAEHATQRIDELDRRVAHAAGAVQALATTTALRTQAPQPGGPLQRLALALLWGGPQGQTFVLTRLANMVLLQQDGNKRSSPLAPLLLLCMAEAAYQATSRLRRANMSRGALRAALAPLQFGTRVCRSVVWASAILLAAQAAKAAAHDASDAVMRPGSRDVDAQELMLLPAVDATTTPTDEGEA